MNSEVEVDFDDLESMLKWFDERIQSDYKHLPELLSARGSINHRKESLKQALLGRSSGSPYHSWEYISLTGCPVKCGSRKYNSIHDLIKQKKPEALNKVSDARKMDILREVREAMILDLPWRGLLVKDARSHKGNWRQRYRGISQESIVEDRHPKSKSHPNAKITWLYKNGKPFKMFMSQRKAANFLGVHPDYIRTHSETGREIDGFTVVCHDEKNFNDLS